MKSIKKFKSSAKAFWKRTFYLILLVFSAFMFHACGEERGAIADRQKAAIAEIDFFNRTGPIILELYQTKYTVIDHYEKWIPVLYIEKDYQAVENRIKDLLKVNDEAKSYDLYLLYKALGNVTQDKQIELMQGTLDEWCQANPESHIPWLVRGIFKVRYAWHIRGTGYASSVSEDVWPKFHSQLESAQKDLEKSYKLNSKDPNSSSLLITVANGLSFPKEKMEYYFQNGVAVCPWHYGLHIKKLNYLKPKWHGSYNEMFEFASQCLLESAQYPSLGLIMADAMKEAHNLNRNKEKKESFLGKDENWEVIEKIFTDFFSQYPDDIRRRFIYAYYAYVATKYDIAISQFEIIGDRWVEGTYWRSLKDYNRCRAFAYYKKGANLLWDRKLYGISIEPFELAVKYHPTANGYYGLGIACWSSGSSLSDLSLLKKAEDALQKALEIQPDHKHAKKYLKDLRKLLKRVKK